VAAEAVAATDRVAETATITVVVAGGETTATIMAVVVDETTIKTDTLSQSSLMMLS
jgi:hypothetical protein